MPLVELKSVGKSYGNITALKDISLRVHAGEVTGILGDNGAGKSTLIKIIAGYHPQTDGELLVDGEPTKFTLAEGRAGQRHRDGVPEPRRRAVDAGVAQLLPRSGDPQEVVPVVVGRQRDARHHAVGAVEDGHRPARRRRADRVAVGRSTPVRGDRAGGVLRCAGADPRRADRRARRQAVGRGAEVHHRGQGGRASASCSSRTTRTTRTWSATTS